MISMAMKMIMMMKMVAMAKVMMMIVGVMAVEGKLTVTRKETRGGSRDDGQLRCPWTDWDVDGDLQGM